MEPIRSSKGVVYGLTEDRSREKLNAAPVAITRDNICFSGMDARTTGASSSGGCAGAGAGGGVGGVGRKVVVGALGHAACAGMDQGRGGADGSGPTAAKGIIAFNSSGSRSESKLIGTLTGAAALTGLGSEIERISRH